MFGPSTAIRRHPEGLRIPHSDSPAGPKFTLLERCGQKVADVVKGQTDPLSLLFPGDYTTSAEWVYADAPFSRVANDLVGETVTALVDTLADNRTLRVLEIGAGTGGTTREVLPRLDQERTEYVFTDLSQSFLKQASERFHANLPLHGKVLDVETDPAAQGFDDGQFDLIIAANVIHATADLKQSLVHARQLLAPGGVLLMLEGTARRGWIDLTFGLTEGWWRFTDTDVRTDHPLLDTDGWLSLLSASGYDDVAAIPVERDSNGCIFEQAILLARAPLDETTTKPEFAIDDKAPWIVFTDNHGVGAGLARLLESHATPCIVVEQTDADGSNGDGQYRVNPTRRQDFVESLEAITRKSGSQPGAVVHLFGTNENVEGGAVDWDASMTRSCGSALHLIQAMDETGVQPERGLWIATRGAQAVAAHDGETSVAQAPLWGLGRVAAREKPDLWGGLVDLDVEADPDRDAAGLLSVVVNHRDENQVALRGTDRFVARYLEKSLDPAAPAAFADDRSYLIVGGTGGIGLKMAQWMVERGARHLTLQSRRGRPADDDVQAAGIVSDLESAGAQVSFVAADSADAARMAEVFAEFGAEKPELAGVIHTAAVIDFQPIEEIGLEDYLAAVRAKVAGSWVLHELTAPLELDFLLLFSSMAAIAGFPQLSHYAAGNCFLDALAHRRRELGLPATSINWGLWSEGRSTSDENKQLFESIGLRAMASDKALQGLERALASGSVQETVAWVDWGAFRPIYESRGASRLLSRLPERAEATSAPEPAADEVQASRFRSELAAADPVAAERMVEDAVSKAVAAILGLGENAVPPRSEGFFQLGMDSIMSVELRRRLESKLQVQLPTTLAFEYPTIEALTGYLVAEVLGIGTSEADPGPAAAKPPEPAEEEDDLDEFSDAELAAELDRELAQLSEGDGGVS